MTVKIATIGSCVVRDNFNTKFNPYYKEYFNLVAHHHQSALPSLMSNPTKFSKVDNYNKTTKFRKQHIQNEFSKQFLQRLKDTSPDYIILDLYADIKFGVVMFDEKTYITNNIQYKYLPELQKKLTLNIYENFNEYFKLWKTSVDELFEFFRNELPKCKIILLNARYHNKFKDNSTLDKWRQKKGIKCLDIKTMNQTWDILDNYVENNFDVFKINMKGGKYSLSESHPWGRYYLHFESKFYKDFLSELLNIIISDKSFENDIVDKKSNLLKNQKLHYEDTEQKLIDAKRIEVVTGSEYNLINLARKNKSAYKLYKELLARDYILYFHKDGISKLYKRKYISELIKRKDLLRSNEVFYTLSEPQGRKINNNIPKKLLVIFTCMPPKDKYDNYLIHDRMFTKFFDGIEKNLVKNVYIMRIMDLNVSHGSHYINTINYSEYEQHIQQTISHVKNSLEIDENNIVFYGVSKGGTGALFHGSLMDKKLLAVDPILNIGGKLEDNDRRFLKNLRKKDLVPEINKNMAQINSKDKYLICSEKVPLYYEQDMRLDREKLKIYNKVDNLITSHPEVSRNTVPEQLMILNILLGGLE